MYKDIQPSPSDQIRTYVFVCTFVLYSIDVDRVVQDVDYLFTDILPYCLPNVPFVY